MSYTAKVIAVLGRTVRAGRWKLADESLVIAVFGRCVLDLSRAYVDEDDDELSMSVFALFGSVSVVLPPGCDVEPSGIAILASSEVEIPSDKAEDITRASLAPLEISWFAMFGRVRINELPAETGASSPLPDETASLGAPDHSVFDDGTTDEVIAPTDSVVEPPSSVPTDGPTAEASAAAADHAALRDEIAQWRSETGRGEPDPRVPVDPSSEIIADEEPEAARGSWRQG